ncbi:hypothetical protein QBC38DRAFT_60133 [Podospora fimiseda]|uniref:2EXR domain-containing protein n=1 Tax=Podospora fimiseda TaxID=252190 RepID=A0AAN7BGY2_9PEZI|nr:hypothetical protein QBC38DRAFT_60133 [Podospora fimiseda]
MAKNKASKFTPTQTVEQLNSPTQYWYRPKQLRKLPKDWVVLKLEPVFLLFPLLPAELRLMIWEFAMADAMETYDRHHCGLYFLSRLVRNRGITQLEWRRLERLRGVTPRVLDATYPSCRVRMERGIAVSCFEAREVAHKLWGHSKIPRLRKAHCCFRWHVEAKDEERNEPEPKPKPKPGTACTLYDPDSKRPRLGGQFRFHKLDPSNDVEKWWRSGPMERFLRGLEGPLHL